MAEDIAVFYKYLKLVKLLPTHLIYHAQTAVLEGMPDNNL